MARFFNTAGPVNPAKHYSLSPLSRLEIEELIQLIDQEKYFVLHAPRQTGKTSVLLALMEKLNREGQYTCLYINVEAAQAMRENVETAMHVIVNELGMAAEHYLKSTALTQIGQDAMKVNGAAYSALNLVLSRWCREADKPIVLLIDEIDSLVGDSLISVLRQLRAGYTSRPSAFPQSVILCGVRDVRDYRLHSADGKEVITGGSAFNIKAKSLCLGNFSPEDIRTLYEQHSQESGQLFEERVYELAWEYTRGQPWLVNALAYETCFEMKAGRDRSQPITAQMFEQAKANLILRRETHLDQLADKLKEERVRRVIEPILAGNSLKDIYDDDLQYVMDLGLVSKGAAGPEISNAIYQEIIPRQLNALSQLSMESEVNPAWYITADGRLDMNQLIAAFQQFFREHSEFWLERFDYKEAGPQLLMQAFLQRIVNGGGQIDREYGLGRGRTDLYLRWPWGSVDTQRVVIELKILHKGLDSTIAQGLEQVHAYADRCGAEEAHLIIFDRNPDKSWEEKIFTRQQEHLGRSISLWGM
jgi:hypothetical protein